MRRSLEEEQAREWRKAEFCISYPPKGNYATGTLHRPSCQTLAPEKRVLSYEPSHVYKEDLEKFRKDASNYGHGGSVKVCQKCCSDIVVAGHRVIQPKPKIAPLEREVEKTIKLKKGELKDFITFLDSRCDLKPEQQALVDVVINQLKG